MEAQGGLERSGWKTSHNLISRWTGSGCAGGISKMKWSSVQCGLAGVALWTWAAGVGLADYKQAVTLYNQGQFDRAIQELKPDLDKNPDWEFGHRLVGL